MLAESLHSTNTVNLLSRPIQYDPSIQHASFDFWRFELFSSVLQSPAPYTSPVDELLVWDQHSKALTRSNNISCFVRLPHVWKHVRDHDDRACRLGLYFFDRWRPSVELRLRTSPKFSDRYWQVIVEQERGKCEAMSIYDEIFRFSRLCDQEAERESWASVYGKDVEGAM